MLKSQVKAAFGLLTLMSVVTLGVPAPQVTESTAKLQVVVSYFEGDKQVGTTPFQFDLVMDRSASLKAATDPKDLPACLPETAGMEQRVGTQVDSFVHPMQDGSFGVNLTLIRRNLEGCRMVGNAQIPVFSNRVTAHTLRLRSGETSRAIVIPDADKNTSTRIEVSLIVSEGDKK